MCMLCKKRRHGKKILPNDSKLPFKKSTNEARRESVLPGQQSNYLNTFPFCSSCFIHLVHIPNSATNEAKVLQKTISFITQLQCFLCTRNETEIPWGKKAVCCS